MARVGRDDGRAELDAGRGLRADGGGENSVHAEDVRKPTAREAVGLGALRLPDQALDGATRARDLADADADAHGGYLPDPSGLWNVPRSTSSRRTQRRQLHC